MSLFYRRWIYSLGALALGATVLSAQEPPSEDAGTKECYVRVICPIPGQADATVAFGEVKPLPYSITVLLDEGQEQKTVLANPTYAYFLTGYRPIAIGNRQLEVLRGQELVKKIPVSFQAGQFYTLLIRDRNGQPDVQVLEDLPLEKDASGNRIRSKTPRLRLANFVPGATASLRSGNAALPLPSGEFVENQIQAGIYEVAIVGQYQNTEFARTVEVNLQQVPQATLFLGLDLYGRPVPYFFLDAVLD